MKKAGTRRRNHPVAGRRAMSASLLVALLAALYVSAPASAADTTCQGTIGAVTVDQVVVPDGAWCRLQGTTVTQNVIIGVDSALKTVNAQVGGNIQGTNGPRKVRILETDVEGDIQLKKTTGPIMIGDAGCEIDPHVGGNIQLEENLGGIAICRMTIDEDLQLTKNTGRRIGVYHNRIGEDMQVAENEGDFTRLRDNKVGLSGAGNMEVIKNLSSARLWRNQVEDKLQCSENDPAPIGGDNTAGDGKEGQCAVL